MTMFAFFPHPYYIQVAQCPNFFRNGVALKAFQNVALRNQGASVLADNLTE